MISTHILDTSHGQPAAGVEVSLEKMNAGQWLNIATEKTNADGRVHFSNKPEAGHYRLHFQVESYFKAKHTASFFTSVPVLFSIQDTTRKYHVPLLLNPYGYSTYRGS